MPETVIIENPSLRSRAAYMAAALMNVCIILLFFYLISVLKGGFVLNFDTDKQIVTICCVLYWCYTLFVRHVASLQFDYTAKTVTLRVVQVIRGHRVFLIPFDDFFYYEEQRRLLRFRDQLYFYRKTKELAGLPKRDLPVADLQVLKQALHEVEKLYPDEA